jgi:prophage maintenance system killer protein
MTEVTPDSRKVRSQRDKEQLIEYVRSEHKRWLSVIGPDDPYVGQTTIGIREVLLAHFLLAEFFVNVGEGLGGIGPKDINLLHSALSRQSVQFGGVPKWSERIDVCATLMFGLIKNHPFFDANKRTAFLTSILHLQKIGRTPTLPQIEYEDFTVAIADNSLSTYPSYARFDLPSPDREIAVISHFLRRNTREIDLKNRNITYKKLDAILHARGLRLEKPAGNRIDVVRFLSKDTLEPLDQPFRIAHVGFHGWTREVSRTDIHTVRSAAQLDVTHGYDSQAFFFGVEDPLSLINKYREPLQRLAYR